MYGKWKVVRALDVPQMQVLRKALWIGGAAVEFNGGFPLPICAIRWADTAGSEKAPAA